jgi:hypothetical protein
MPIPLAASSSPHVPLLYYAGAGCCLLAVAGIGVAIWLLVRSSRRKAQAPPPPMAAPRPPLYPTGPVNVADQLRQLADLRDKGILTEEEFQAQKGRLLGS